MIKIAVCQIKTLIDREAPMARTAAMLREAAAKGADFVVLPEMFNCPYSGRWFRQYAAEGHESSVAALSALAAELGVYVVGGSMPESEGGKIYNTCFIFDRKGRLIARHRKVHLFDSDILGFPIRESDTFSPGDAITVFDTEFGPMGCAICYDLRFPEMFRAMAERGAQIVFVPAQFNMQSGPHHWRDMLGARAIDYQYFVVGAAAARNRDFRYECYGHSLVVDPYGDLLVMAGEDEEIVYADVDLSRIGEVRGILPIIKSQRRDLYTISE